jgi:hypothetical protein
MEAIVCNISSFNMGNIIVPFTIDSDLMYMESSFVFLLSYKIAYN